MNRPSKLNLPWQGFFAQAVVLHAAGGTPCPCREHQKAVQDILTGIKERDKRHEAAMEGQDKRHAAATERVSLALQLPL